MKTKPNISPSDFGKSTGLPAQFAASLTLARGDLQSLVGARRNVLQYTRFRTRITLVRQNPETRSVDWSPDVGPPGTMQSHPEQSRSSTSEGSDATSNYQILRPDKSGFRMAVHHWWSPPGRNGPRGISPPKPKTRHPERSRSSTSEGSDATWNYQILRPDKLGFRMTVHHWWSPPGRNGPIGSSPPNPRTRHPEGSRYLAFEGSDATRNYQILRPQKSVPGMTMAGWKHPDRRKHSAGENSYSVQGLREERKFSRSSCFGTPSFSPIADWAEELLTISAFS